MAETKAAKEKATAEYVALRNFDEFTHGERVYLHDSPRVKGLVDGGYLEPAEAYDERVSLAVRNQMARETGVPTGPGGSPSRQ